MNDKSAELLIEKTFSNEFDLENFKEFLMELFNEYDNKEENKNIPNQYKEFVRNIISLGSYSDNDKISVIFYAIELKKSSSVDRARNMQRNLIGNFLRNRKKKAALVAFYETNSKDWRFSYVKRSLKLGEDGLNEELSAPERYSFLVGPNEPNHTCKTQFKDLIQNEKEISLISIEDAFKIEKVSEEFYTEYNKLYNKLKKCLEKIIKKNQKIKLEFEEKSIKPKDFAKKLMGQLVFIYFLQKKGFLGVEENSNWGSGPKNFLKKLFENKENFVENYNNFFNDIIEPLFYEGLSVDNSDYHYAKFGYKVPFINGGLFNPINDYDWRNAKIPLEDSIFEKIIETFNQFNFTVKEDDPLEQEVAIDLEMLGKFFQYLFEKDEQKNKGVYYTPSHIVHYMCQELLINYLSINSKVSKRDLKKFIKEGDNLIDCIIKNYEEDEENFFTHNKLLNSIKTNSEELYSLLSKVKIIDPAVGSGALLLSMMNEIIKAKHIILLLNGNKDINFYDLKRETIENSLYGVDIDSSAIEITKLRFSLSLIVDEENGDFLRPLPNLDNKIKQGNSLVDSFDDDGFFDNNIMKNAYQIKFPITNPERALNKLEFKKQEYFKTSGFTSKNILKNEIKELKWNFIENHLKNHHKDNIISTMKEDYFEDNASFFIWELEFSEVFNCENPGFDIVIGHPPFGTRLPFGIEFQKKEFDFLKEKYLKQNAKPQKVIYFIELAYNKLLKNNGELGFIVPKSFTYVSQYIPIRQCILDNIETVIDCGEAWKNVKGEQIILVVNKSQNFDSYYNGTMVDESLEINLKELDKKDIKLFGCLLTGVNNKEIDLAKKIRKSNLFLESFTKNKKGAYIQKKVCPNEKFDLIGGNEIQREGIVAIQGKIGEENIKEPCYIKDNSVLVQEIIAQSGNHIKITACIPNSRDLYICNTISQIIIEKFTNFSNYFFWTLFNSKLINWYCHKFIYANAILAIHFNSAASNKIPLPSFDDEELISIITNKSKQLHEKYKKLLLLKKPMFDCLWNNINFTEEIINFENLNFADFIEILESKQKIKIKKVYEKNIKKFFTSLKVLCLEKNKEIEDLETDSIDLKDKLNKELLLLKESMFDYLKNEFIHKIKTTTDGKIKNFELLEYNDFIDELSNHNVDTSNIDDFEEFFNDIKYSCFAIHEEIEDLEEELNLKIYDLYKLDQSEKKIIDEYFSS